MTANLAKYFNPYVFYAPRHNLPFAWKRLYNGTSLFGIEYKKDDGNVLTYRIVPKKKQNGTIIEPVVQLLNNLKLDTDQELIISNTFHKPFGKPANISRFSFSPNVPLHFALSIRDIFENQFIQTYHKKSDMVQQIEPIENPYEQRDPMENPYEHIVDADDKVSNFRKDLHDAWTNLHPDKKRQLLEIACKSYFPYGGFIVKNSNFRTPNANGFNWHDETNLAIEFLQSGQRKHILCGNIKLSYKYEGGLTSDTYCPFTQFLREHNASESIDGFGDMRGNGRYDVCGHVPFWKIHGIIDSLRDFGLAVKTTVVERL